MSATFDQAIGTSSTAHVYEEAHGVQGSEVPAGSVKTVASSTMPGATVDTILFTPAQVPIPIGTYVAVFKAVPHTGTPPADDPSLASTVAIHFSVTNVAPDVPNTVPPSPDAINAGNATAVPFTGSAPAGQLITVNIVDTAHPGVAGQPGPNDASGKSTVADCGADQCPYTVRVDTSKAGPTGGNTSPDTSSPTAPVYKWSATATNSAGSKSTALQPIIKDTSAPGAPTNPADDISNDRGSQRSVVTTSAQHNADIDHYLVIVTDDAGDPAQNQDEPAGSDTNHSLSAPIDVSALADGDLKVAIFAVDEAGNVSGAAAPTNPIDSLTVTKESVLTAAKLAASTLTIDGQGVPFSHAQSGFVGRPQSINVAFNEPIRLTWDSDESNQVTGPVIKHAGLCLQNSHGLCLGGTLNVTSDNRTLTWTPSAALPDGSYTLTNVKVFALAQSSCPDADPAIDPTPTSCETYDSAQNGSLPHDPLTSFTIDTSSPNPPTVTVTPASTIDGAADPNGRPHAADVTFAGTAEPDSNVLVTVKSSGGGALLVANPSGQPVTADSTGSWALNDVDITSLPDGLLTVTATATDKAGNKSAAGAPTSAPTLAARPTPPVNLTATTAAASATLSWSPPTGNGGAPISGYTLNYTDTSANGSAQTVNGVTSPYTITGLITGDSYALSVCATNGVGGPCNNATVTALPRYQTKLAFTVSKSTVTFGTSVGLSGSLTRMEDGAPLGSKAITITPRLATGSVARAVQVTTHSDGSWSVSLQPSKNTTYVAAFTGDRSDQSSATTRRVFVRWAVGLAKVTASSSSHRSPVTIAGSVRPSQTGLVVLIYERRGTRNVLLGRVRTTSRSTFSFRWTFGVGVHYVFAAVASGSGNAAGVSRRVRFSRS